MISSPSGAERISVQGVGPVTNVVAITQLRDSAGYLKMTPLPAREMTIAGVVTPGFDIVSGLATTDDGLAGSHVSGGGLADGTIVVGVLQPAVAQTATTPGTTGAVRIFPAAPGDVPDPGLAAPAPVDLKFDIPSEAIVIPDGVSRLQLDPVEPLAALTVKLPRNPVDGQFAFIYSTEEIGELTILPNQGQSLNWSPAPPKAEPPKADQPLPPPPFLKLMADCDVGYLYSAPNWTWDRIH